MDQENHTWNGAAAGSILLVKFIFSVDTKYVLEKAHYCQWASWNFCGIYNKKTPKNQKSVWVYIPQKALWMPNFAFPTPLPSPHNSHGSAHQDWVRMPCDSASLEICCPSLSGLPCALKTFSFVEKRCFLENCHYPRTERTSPPISSKDKPDSPYLALHRRFPA